VNRDNLRTSDYCVSGVTDNTFKYDVIEIIRAPQSSRRRRNQQQTNAHNECCFD